MYGNILLLILLTVLLSKFFLRSMVAMLSASADSICMTENYRKKRIPSIGGIAYIPLLLTASMLLSPLMPVFNAEGMLFLSLMSCIGFIGLLDDLLGDKSTKGIKNHIKKTFGGTLTTGFLKAFTGLVLSFIASAKISSGLLEFITNLFVISLFTNTINLLDLRPGRAVKSFLAISFILMISNISRTFDILPLLMLHIISWVYISYDLKETCMLGDTGSNVLGIALGYYSALLLDLSVKIILLLVLTGINVLSEKVSITDIIEKSRILSYLDRLGRS